MRDQARDGIAAFFDMDRTVLRVNSGTLWMRYQRQRGELPLPELLRALYWSVQYRLSILDMETVAAKLTAEMTGKREEDLVQKTQTFFWEQVAPSIGKTARETIESHRKKGHLLAILTSSTPYIAEPLAEHLGIDHTICTRLHVKDGRFLGTCDRPTCYGRGKVHHAERFAERHGINLDRSFFYTDSYSDLPMLLRVGERRVVNPDLRLARHARKSGWEIERWD